MDIAKLETKVSGAFGWLGLLTVAVGVAFLFLISAMSDIRKDVSGVQSTIAGQVATTAGIQSSLTRIEDKLDKADDRSVLGQSSKNGKH